VPGAVSVGVAGSIAFLFFSPLGPATGDGAAGAAGVTPLGADLFAVIYGIRVSCTAVLSSPALAEVKVNNSPPAGMSSRKVTFSDTLADVALEANIAIPSASAVKKLYELMKRMNKDVPIARFRACDCLSIAPGVFGTQAIAAAVIDSVPGIFLKSASYRLTVDASPDILNESAARSDGCQL
jgi:hypothetical protein